MIGGHVSESRKQSSRISRRRKKEQRREKNEDSHYHISGFSSVGVDFSDHHHS